MLTLINIEELTNKRNSWIAHSESIAFVPTMGALHDGHLSLVHRAKELAQKVVVSIFVNPTQFGPNEDFAKYPRTLAEDIKKLEQVGVDVVFAPNAAEIYGDDFQTFVSNKKMSNYLCGISRPGHFDGVLTIVLKLFNIVKPQYAIFGKKDYQQYKLIQQMVKDLCLDIDIVGVETKRESDGLALSSRNRYLKPKSRDIASAIYIALTSIKEQFKLGEYNVSKLKGVFTEHLSTYKNFNIEYIEIRDSAQLDDISEIKENKPAVVLCAVKLDGVRLIDNIELD